MTTSTASDLFFQAWSEATGQEPDPRIIKQHERTAWEFLNAGFLPSELIKVVRYMQHENTKGGRFKVQLHKVAGDLERFASILSDIKAKDRNRRPSATPKEQVLAMRDPLLKTEECDPRINGAGRHITDVLKHLGNQ